MTRRTKQSDPPADSQPPTDQPSFEDSLEELEAIVQSMDGDRLPLEDLLAKYERGTQLIKICQSSIDLAQQRVELIMAGKSGATLEPFSAEAAAAPPQPSRPAQPKPPASTALSDDEIRLF